MIFLIIKLVFIVIRYLMTSSWRHNARLFYLLCSKYMPSSCEVCKYVFFVDNRSAEEEEVEEEEEEKTNNNNKCFAL